MKVYFEDEFPFERGDFSGAPAVSFCRLSMSDCQTVSDFSQRRIFTTTKLEGFSLPSDRV